MTPTPTYGRGGPTGATTQPDSATPRPRAISHLTKLRMILSSIRCHLPVKRAGTTGADRERSRAGIQDPFRLFSAITRLSVTACGAARAGGFRSGSARGVQCRAAELAVCHADATARLLLRTMVTCSWRTRSHDHAVPSTQDSLDALRISARGASGSLPHPDRHDAQPRWRRSGSRESASPRQGPRDLR